MKTSTIPVRLSLDRWSCCIDWLRAPDQLHSSNAELIRCTNVIAPFERARAIRIPVRRTFRR